VQPQFEAVVLAHDFGLALGRFGGTLEGTGE
jgi:hypothetical protein